MDKAIFLLIDTLSEEFYNQYSQQLQMIHQALLKKLTHFQKIIVGSKDSPIAEYKFHDTKSLYQFMTRYSQDIIIIDAYAGLLSLKDTENILQYLHENDYDVCLTENLPEGLIPMIISKDFINDFSEFLEEGQKLTSSLKTMINWEYQGIDVGIYLSSSLVVMQRIDFLPKNKGTIEWILQIVDEPDFCVERIDDFIKKYPQMLRNNPAYMAIELSPKMDYFMGADFTHKDDMSVTCFQKIISECQELAPELMISLGVWGEPLLNPDFKEIFHTIQQTQFHILVESRGLYLNRELCELILSRPHTELIFDISFSTENDYKKYKKTPYSLHEISEFIRTLPNREHIWIRLTRTHQSEAHIPLFLKQWHDFMPHVLITKADSFGDPMIKVVDLAPIRRHACWALRRELTILSDGMVMLCRQDKRLEHSLGFIQELSLKELWDNNQHAFLEQEKGLYNTCAACSQCDDWWIWN